MRCARLGVIALLVLSSIAWTSGQEDPDVFAEQEANATTLIRRHAYMASLRDFDGNHFCTGVLISQNHVLTAAHCLDPRSFPLATPNPEVHIGLLRTDEVDEKAMVRRSSANPGLIGFFWTRETLFFRSHVLTVDFAVRERNIVQTFRVFHALLFNSFGGYDILLPWLSSYEAMLVTNSSVKIPLNLRIVAKS